MEVLEEVGKVLREIGEDLRSLAGLYLEFIYHSWNISYNLQSRGRDGRRVNPLALRFVSLDRYMGGNSAA